MSRGIALQMRRKFGQVDQLRKEQKSVTDVTVIQSEQRTIFYLLTKEHHWQKSTYQAIYSCLQKLKELCMQLKITSLACPRIGSEADGLQWEIIRNMYRNTFGNLKHQSLYLHQR
ncbi:ADP-ribose glycohydrolase OARD1-like [Metopolophium dirhodum]|uniref:ADP-ribose glycohydrolase OARD1-like n=1 Tax=Metopolophium dirhodum TaxID=44670 RepID=UPI0029904FE5|nr:ADP-ribose glycohydrolase OARD1-like [Metopolophium dirhodum]